MTTRAAINILGSTGEVIDITSLGVSNLTTQHPGPGQYLVLGTLGMVPPPLGWGHVVNQLDADCSVSISFNEGILAVSVARDGEPSDLLHSITLHVAVEELPPMVAPEPDKAELAQRELSSRRSDADHAIAPLQDAVDVDEATESDMAALKAWKKYRLALSRVPDQAGYPLSIEWPVAPA